MSSPKKKPAKASSPKKPRTRSKKATKAQAILPAEPLPDPFTLDELTESYKSLPAADLPPVEPTVSSGKPKQATDQTSKNETGDISNGSSNAPKNTWSDVSQTKDGKTLRCKHADYQIAQAMGDVDSKRKGSPETTQTETQSTGDATGDVPLSVGESATGYADSTLESPLLAHARLGESRHTCWERLRKEGRSAGLPKGQGPGTAYEWATREVERLFPAPLPPEPVIEAVEPEPLPEPEPPAEPELQMSPIGDMAASDSGVSGLGDIPSAWGELPANAQLQVEIAWVSANRLRVRDGSGVNLSRALSPAPSYSALSWLETSILFPSKFADISVKATANQDDEKEHIRREKMAIEEIRGILAEMLEG